jgi:hypothetical protein
MNEKAHTSRYTDKKGGLGAHAGLKVTGLTKQGIPMPV